MWILQFLEFSVSVTLAMKKQKSLKYESTQQKSSNPAGIQPPAPNMCGMVMDCSMVEVMKLSKSDSDTTMKRCTEFEQGSLRWSIWHCKLTKGFVSWQKNHSSSLIYFSTALLL